MPLEPGQTLSHYHLVEKIGQGGMGVVWKARDEKLRRDVALKVLPPDLVQDPERRRRFLHEARAAAAVNHANIATIHDVDEADGQVFIAMEFVEGKSLRVLLAGGPLPIPEAIGIGAQISQGLARAHKAGVVHRDLKPENIIIGPEKEVKILDFGLAKLLEGQAEASSSNLTQAETLTEEMTREGRILGTPAYMSPEQVRGDPVDTRSDVFSFGGMLYEMVAGRRPFQGRTQADTLAAILNQPAIPPSQSNPEIPARLEQILARCLEKDPLERYRDTEDLAVDLRKLRGTTEPGVPAFRAAQRRATRWPLALLGLVAIVVIISGYLRFRPGQPEAPSGTAAIDSLAVIPFVNLSGDSEQDYFADGMTEALIMNLSKIEALTIISRTSAMQYKNTDKSLPLIAQELGVEAIVEGSVLLVNEEVRVTAQLVDASTDRPLWADSYDRDLRNILVLQSEVAQAIAQEIQVTLTPLEQARLASTREVDPAAYEAYIRGRHFAEMGTEEAFGKAVDYFKEAIAIDPDYALAHVGLTGVYVKLWGFGFRQTLPEMLESANQALEIDDQLGAAYAARGIARKLNWDWAGAEADLKRALDLSPGHVTSHARYAKFLVAMGHDAEGLAESERARELDPVSPGSNVSAGETMYLARRYNEASEHYRRTAELFPDYFDTYVHLGETLSEEGRHEEAIRELQRAMTLSGGSRHAAEALGWAYAKAGKRGKALEVLVGLEVDLETQPGRSGRGSNAGEGDKLYKLAWIYVALDEKERALELLEQAHAQHASELYRLKVEPALDDLRADPRFQDLLRRMNFPE